MFQQDIQKFDINVLHKTQDGYYQGNVVCTGVGVFKYLGDDRKFVGRLRDVEDVKAATKSSSARTARISWSWRVDRAVTRAISETS